MTQLYISYVWLLIIIKILSGHAWSLNFVSHANWDTNSAMLREFCQMTVGAVDTARVSLADIFIDRVAATLTQKWISIYFAILVLFAIFGLLFSLCTFIYGNVEASVFTCLFPHGIDLIRGAKVYQSRDRRVKKNRKSGVWDCRIGTKICPGQILVSCEALPRS